MNDDPIFNIHFVHVIERYRCLWDHTHEHYGKKDEIEKAWKDVVNIVHDSVSNCHKRWRKIQTNFLKFRKPLVGSGSSAQKKKLYDYLQDHLHFLNMYVEDKKITDIYNTEHPCDIDKKEFAEFQICGNTKRSFEEVDGDFPQKHDTGTKKLKMYKDIIVISDSESEDCSSIRKSEKSKTDCDSDITFLKSLVKYIKLMNNSQKRKLKKKFIKVIDKILEENYSKNNSEYMWNLTPYTSSSNTTEETDIYQKYVKNSVSSIIAPPQSSPLPSTEFPFVDNIDGHHWLCNLSIQNHDE